MSTRSTGDPPNQSFTKISKETRYSERTYSKERKKEQLSLRSLGRLLCWLRFVHTIRRRCAVALQIHVQHRRLSRTAVEQVARNDRVSEVNE